MLAMNRLFYPSELALYSNIGTYPSFPGLLIQCSYPGLQPLAPPTIQRQNPGQQRIRLALLTRIPRFPSAAPQSTPNVLEEINGKRDQSSDKQGHQPEPLRVSKPRHGFVCSQHLKGGHQRIFMKKQICSSSCEELLMGRLNKAEGNKIRWAVQVPCLMSL